MGYLTTMLAQVGLARRRTDPLPETLLVSICPAFERPLQRRAVLDATLLQLR